ncbi:hypothetical protein [Actinomadura violacea]|uniref:Uncharacterized protein n=1 Tax=Actinomadura violacea TaxID=2819934 RepID=A0ABS3S439_9ACTN|nr:hypothetical protein [Actinomadura violacea]MBO2463771.1 hypothetical protein [Actinomadura violacea]
MTLVVLAGDLPSTGILGSDVAHRFDPNGGGDAPAAFVDLMAQALGWRGSVLVLHPAWREDGVPRLVRLARAALLSDRIARIPLDLPPLALSLIADQLAFTASHSDAAPGALAVLALRLCKDVYAGAWVNSVARLERVKTGLGAHVSSYLPGSGFAVTTGQDGDVHRITAARRVPAIGVRPVDPVLMLCTGENGDADWLRTALVPALAAVKLMAVGAQPLSTEYWGTKRYAEFVAFSGHPRALESSLAASACRLCAWCGEPTALPECPFCMMVQPEAASGPVANGPVRPRGGPASNGASARPAAPPAPGPAPGEVRARDARSGDAGFAEELGRERTRPDGRPAARTPPGSWGNAVQDPPAAPSSPVEPDPAAEPEAVEDPSEAPDSSAAPGPPAVEDPPAVQEPPAVGDGPGRGAVVPAAPSESAGTGAGAPSGGGLPHRTGTIVFRPPPPPPPPRESLNENGVP